MNRPSVATARRLLWVVLGLGLAVMLLSSPISGWWDQRGRLSEAETELALIEADNDELQRRIDNIADPAELEFVARRDLGLVREGEELYEVLPPPTAGLALPNTWPFDRISNALSGAP